MYRRPGNRRARLYERRWNELDVYLQLRGAAAAFDHAGRSVAPMPRRCRGLGRYRAFLRNGGAAGSRPDFLSVAGPLRAGRRYLWRCVADDIVAGWGVS